MAETLELPIIDLSSTDRISTANAIRQACMECGFFYLVNHEVEEKLLQKLLEGNKAFFALPLDEKMKLARKDDCMQKTLTHLPVQKVTPKNFSALDLLKT